MIPSGSQVVGLCGRSSQGRHPRPRTPGCRRQPGLLRTRRRPWEHGTRFPRPRLETWSDLATEGRRVAPKRTTAVVVTASSRSRNGGVTAASRRRHGFCAARAHEREAAREWRGGLDEGEGERGGEGGGGGAAPPPPPPLPSRARTPQHQAPGLTSGASRSGTLGGQSRARPPLPPPARTRGRAGTAVTRFQKRPNLKVTIIINNIIVMIIFKLLLQLFLLPLQ